MVATSQPGLSRSTRSSPPVWRNVLIDGFVSVRWRWHSWHCGLAWTVYAEMVSLTAGRPVRSRTSTLVMWSCHVIPRHHWSKASKRATSALVGARHRMHRGRSVGCRCCINVVWSREQCEHCLHWWFFSVFIPLQFANSLNMCALYGTTVWLTRNAIKWNLFRDVHWK